MIQEAAVAPTIDRDYFESRKQTHQRHEALGRFRPVRLHDNGVGGGQAQFCSKVCVLANPSCHDNIGRLGDRCRDDA